MTSTSDNPLDKNRFRTVSRDNDDDVAAVPSSSTLTDRIVEDNVNALIARNDDSGFIKVETSSIDDESSESESESEEAVRASDVSSKEYNKRENLSSNLAADSRDNVSSITNNNDADNNKILSSNDKVDERLPKKIERFGINGDAKSIDNNSSVSISDRKPRNISRDEVSDEETRSRSIFGKEDEDDFLARVVREYNRTREDFDLERSGMIGSSVKNVQNASFEDSIFDKNDATTSTKSSNVAESLQEIGKSYENAEKQKEAKNGSTDSRNDSVPSEDFEESDIEYENRHGGSKFQVNSLALVGSSEKYLTRIEEEESNETEPDNLVKAKNGKIEGNVEAMEHKSNSDKTDAKFVESSSEDESTDSNEISVRGMTRVSATAAKENETDVENVEERNVIGEKVENLFDDNGWVVTEEDSQPRINETINAPSLSLAHTENSEAFQNETDKTDYCIGYSKNDDDIFNETESESSSQSNELSIDWKKLSISHIDENNSTIGSNGWLVTDESKSESERIYSPIEAIHSHESPDTLSDDNSRFNISRIFLPSDEDSPDENITGENNSSPVDTKRGNETLGSSQSWLLLDEHEVDENDIDKGRVNDKILKDSSEKDSKELHENEQPSRIHNKLSPKKHNFSESTKENNDDPSSSSGTHNKENDYAEPVVEDVQLLRNKTKYDDVSTTKKQSTEIKDLEEYDGNGNDDDDEAPMNVPMKMVTTVFCVSVLCYSVLMNLFL